MITLTSSGSFSNLERFLDKAEKLDIRSVLEAGGKMGVDALSNATPVDSGLARTSWSYEVQITAAGYSLVWTNDNVENGFPVVIMLQYGHGTGTGGYVRGRDFINPAIKPVFDKIANDIWKAVTTA